MEWVALFDFLGIIFSLLSLFILIIIKSSRMKKNLKLIVFIIQINLLIAHIGNYLEWTGITNVFDPYEEYIQIIITSFLFILIFDYYHKSLSSQLIELERYMFEHEKWESFNIISQGFAHDINNVLTGILGNMSLLKDYKIDDEFDEIICDLENSTYRARELVKILRSFGVDKQFAEKSYNIGDFIREVADFSMRGTQSILKMDIEEDLYAKINPSSFERVIQNIIINGIQAMPDGGTIIIKVKSAKAIKKDKLFKRELEYIQISIKDSGIGIPKEIQSKIFNPRFTTKKGGTGLGLSIAQKIIMEHNGFITFKSKENSGTTFKIFIPKTNERPKIRSNALHGEKNVGNVILLDDDKKLLSILKKNLKKTGFHVDISSDGRETLEKIKKQKENGIKYDFIILDKIIPGGKGGREIIKEVRNISPDSYIIISSGTILEHEPKIYLNLGFDAILEKPYKFDDLINIFNKKGE